MSNSEVIAPLVNINGSCKRDLTTAHYKAFEALNAYKDFLRLTAPHGRDYQNSPAGDFVKAREQFKARMDTVNGLLREHNELFRAIDNQGK